MSHLSEYAIRSHSNLLEMNPRPDWIFFLKHTFVQLVLLLGVPPVLFKFDRFRAVWDSLITQLGNFLAPPILRRVKNV